MAWNLEIHTIDVAQGESSLLVARNVDEVTGGQISVSSMLIDGGLQRYGRRVHQYVTDALEGEPLDVMITTHYDEDHSEGQISILLADNITVISQVIGDAVANAILEKQDERLSSIEQAIAGGAAFAAVTQGAYDFRQPNGVIKKSSELVSVTVDEVLQKAQADPNRPTNKRDGMDYGLRWGLDSMDYVYNSERGSNLMKNSYDALHAPMRATVTPLLRMTIEDLDFLEVAVKSCFSAIAPDWTKTDTTMAADDPSRNSNFGFFTNGMYKNTRVYNNGDSQKVPLNNNVYAYMSALNGKVEVVSYKPTAPLLGRTSTVPTLGAELWQIPDPAAPKVYCVSVLGRVLKSGDEVTGDAYNKISIGVVVVFNSFVYYTGGDLPVSGLNMIPNAVINNPTFGRPARIPASKSGHHGSSESNSDFFLEETNPVSTIISSGSESFHGTVLPTQEVIDMYINAAAMKYFYLTNCKIIREGVPGSNGQPQLVPGNRSRIAGDNEFDIGEEIPKDKVGEPKPKRSRGNILLRISQEESMATGIFPAALDDFQTYRKFSVTYWEEEQMVGPQVPIGTRTEILFY